MRVKYFDLGLMVLFMLAALLIPSVRADKYVSMDGSDGADGNGWGTALRNIQTAVTAANDGETIWISNGTYDVSATISVAKNIAIRGNDGEEIIISATDSHRCFNMTAAGAASVFSNLTITGTSGVGGGITTLGGTFIGCVFEHNSAAGNGGAIDSTSHNNALQILSCEFKQNKSGYDGGALYFSGLASLTVTGCQFIENEATRHGGGMYINNADFTVSSNFFKGNITIDSGGGFYCYDSPETYFTHNILEDNTARNAGGAFYSGNFSGRVISDCRFVRNTATNASGGVQVHAGQVLVRNCFFISNQVVNTSATGIAGGMQIYAGNSWIENSHFLDNTAGYGGAGINIGAGATGVKVRNCLIARNVVPSSGRGGGIGVSGGAVELINCTIVSNVCANGAGIWLSSTYAQTSVNCIVYYNTTAGGAVNNIIVGTNTTALINNCIPQAFDGAYPRAVGNLTDPPEFVDFEGGDYRLVETSPCVNQGYKLEELSGLTDLDGRRRVDRFAGMPDIGCYEYLPAGVMFRLQ